MKICKKLITERVVYMIINHYFWKSLCRCRPSSKLTWCTTYVTTCGMYPSSTSLCINNLCSMKSRTPSHFHGTQSIILFCLLLPTFNLPTSSAKHLFFTFIQQTSRYCTPHTHCIPIFIAFCFNVYCAAAMNSWSALYKTLP